MILVSGPRGYLSLKLSDTSLKASPHEGALVGGSAAKASILAGKSSDFLPKVWEVNFEYRPLRGFGRRKRSESATRAPLPDRINGRPVRSSAAPSHLGQVPLPCPDSEVANKTFDFQGASVPDENCGIGAISRIHNPPPPPISARCPFHARKAKGQLNRLTSEVSRGFSSR